MNKRNEKGSALIISLLIVIAMTLLGVSGLNMSRFHERMSSNSQYHAISFQAADSAIEGTIADASVLSESINASGGAAPMRSFDITPAGKSYTVTSSSETTAGAPYPAVGYSIGEFVAYPFTIRATGGVPENMARSIHVQTIERAAPSAN